MTNTKRCALVYGSCTGKTEELSETLRDAFLPELELQIVDIATLEASDLKQYELVICGIPTWDVGELEYGWQDVYDNLDGVDLSGLTIAIFGLGDQFNYSETYQDAMGILYEKLIECGATGGIGFTSTEGHEFEGSRALIDDQFCGLALDEDNQDELSEARIKGWVAQVKPELRRTQPELFSAMSTNENSEVV